MRRLYFEVAGVAHDLGDYATVIGFPDLPGVLRADLQGGLVLLVDALLNDLRLHEVLVVQLLVPDHVDVDFLQREQLVRSYLPLCLFYRENLGGAAVLFLWRSS